MTGSDWSRCPSLEVVRANTEVPGRSHVLPEAWTPVVMGALGYVLFVVSVMAQLVLCGGMVPVTGRLGLDQLSVGTPARWGYAAAASTVALRTLVPGSLVPEDRFWQHTSTTWLLDMGMLAALSLFYGGFVRWRIRLRR